MGRMYIVNHWNDAAAYSGEQIGDRLKDSQSLHFNRDGSANVDLYSEETAARKRKTSVPLKQRILPQFARIEKLTAEIIELENAYRAGEYSDKEYTLLRGVAFKKRDRAIELYHRAISVKPTSVNDEAEDTTESPSNTEENSPFVREKSLKNDLQSYATAVIILFMGCTLISYFL